MKELTPEQNKLLEAFKELIIAYIELYNSENPSYPITIEEVLNQLNKPKKE